MFGAMFNDKLKAKVRVLCEDIAKLDWLDDGPSDVIIKPKRASWWPAGLGSRSTSVRRIVPFFPERRVGDRRRQRAVCL